MLAPVRMSRARRARSAAQAGLDPLVELRIAGQAFAHLESALQVPARIEPARAALAIVGVVERRFDGGQQLANDIGRARVRRKVCDRAVVKRAISCLRGVNR